MKIWNAENNGIRANLVPLLLYHQETCQYIPTVNVTEILRAKDIIENVNEHLKVNQIFHVNVDVFVYLFCNTVIPFVCSERRQDNKSIHTGYSTPEHSGSVHVGGQHELLDRKALHSTWDNRCLLSHDTCHLSAPVVTPWSGEVIIYLWSKE